MTSITLFWRPGTCARVVYVALEEIGEPFEVQTLNAFKGEMQSPEFRAVNPKGKVPALRLDDWVITENPVILRVLDRRFPQAGLLPAGDERTETAAAEMMAWFASGLHPAVARHRFPGRFTTSEDPAEWQGIRLHARKELAAAFSILEERLQTRDWLFGDWSVIDVYMLYLWWRAVGSGMDPHRSRGAPITGGAARHARPWPRSWTATPPSSRAWRPRAACPPTGSPTTPGASRPSSSPTSDRHARGRRDRHAHPADLSSAAKSATGPRCVSLSGLTTELMLVIWPSAISSATTAISRCCASR